MLPRKIKNPENEASNILINNLNHFIEQKGIHEAALARQTGIPQPTLHKILTGKTTDPRMSTLQILANYFGTTLDMLYAKKSLQHNTNTIKGESIPIISWSDCIHFQAALKKSSSLESTSWIIVNKNHAEGQFALKSKAASEPHFPRGTVFVIDTKTPAKDGDLVIAHYPDTKECALRELSIDGRIELLLPLNVRGEPDKLVKSIKIIGIVTESRFLYGVE